MSTPYYADAGATLYHGDCVQTLRSDALGYDWELGYHPDRLFPDASVHAVVTDPPYGLSEVSAEAVASALTQWVSGDRAAAPKARGFMGKSWDAFVPPPAVWDEAMRVLKPGGYLLAFAGSRTVDLMGLSIRLAGFEIRDSIAWLYGSGFPKSMDVSKAIDKAAGAVREVTGTRRRAGGPAGMTASRGWNDGPMANDDATVEVTVPATDAAREWEGWGTALKPAFEPIVVARKPLIGTVAANVLAHGTGALNIAGSRVGVRGGTRAVSGSTPNGKNDVYGEGMGGNPIDPDFEAGRWPTNVVLDESQAAALDEQTGVLTSGIMRAGQARAERDGAIYGKLEGDTTTRDTYGDSGGASRFFPTFRYEAKAPTSERPGVDDVQHPTVKPLVLMRWLVRLVTPPGGTILEPFAGSGTTLEACLLEGFDVIGIEREADYLPLIMQRIKKPLQQSLFGSLAAGETA